MTKVTIPFLILLFLALIGCADTEAEPAPTPTPTPSPQDWLNASIEAWNTTESFHFVLALENRAIPIDPSGNLAFSQAEGDVVAPDKFQASTVVKTVLGNIEVAFIAIGEDEWLTNPLNKEWEKAPVSSPFQVADLFGSEQGIAQKVKGAIGLERDADETVDGVQTVHLRGNLSGEVLADFAPELAEQKQVKMDLWINQSDNRIQKLVITEPAIDGISPIWTFTFTQYNEVPDIEPPI